MGLRKITVILLLMMAVCGKVWGAEFLVIQKSGSHYTHAKANDIIAIKEDGHKWGKKECLPLFKVIKKPGMTLDEAKKYEESLMEEVDVVVDSKTVKETKVVRDRKYYFDGDTIKTKVLATEKTAVINEKALLEVNIEK